MSRLKPTRFPRRKPTRSAFLEIYKALRRHYGHRHWWPGETPFEVMVGAVLTQNTSWRNVEKAMENLKMARLLSPRKLSQLSATKLATLIRPAGYFNVKARRLRNFLNYFLRNYKGNVQKMFQTPLHVLREKLLQVNGIGPETADSILLYAGGKPSFVVDAYTRRVFSRHRYLKGDEEYDVIQNLFQKTLHRSTAFYNDYHAQIVEVAKDFCKKNPDCDSCPLRTFL